jgi:signal transduction histidine kinase
LRQTGLENPRLYQSLQEQDRRKDEFLAMLAHELRNPLAPISAAAELLKLGTANEDRIRQSSGVIGRQVRHLTSLIDDLLDVSRVTRGLIQIDRTLLDPMVLIASAVE